MIVNRYPSSDPDHLFETSSLPSMPDKEGHLILLNRQLDIIDEVYYSEEMHSSSLSEYEGVALERSDSEVVSEWQAYWFSATKQSGYGTPGAPNSCEDHDVPQVTGYEVTGKKSLRISFNEEISGEMLFPENYSLNESESKPLSVKFEPPLSIIVTFYRRI